MKFTPIPKFSDIRLSTMLLIVMPALTIAAFHYTTSKDAVAEARQPSGIVGSQPATWVPFEADVTILSPGEPNIVGRFYRSSDGSTRLVTESEDRSQRVISIKNVSQQRLYILTRGGAWLSNPMTLPRNGWRPPQFAAGRAGIGEVPLSQQVEGFQVYRQTLQGDDVVHLRAPALNFFPIVRQDLLSGKRQIYSNIRLIEPPAGLFTPPPGAAVRDRPEPKGIVAAPASGNKFRPNSQ